MPLSSMTGFARGDGAHDGWRWTLEAKSVNGRAFEPRFRLPAGFDRLEPALRREAAAHVSRGNLNVNLSLSATPGEGALRVNEAALTDALALVRKIAERIECDRPRPEGVLALRGVLESAEGAPDDAALAALDEAILASFRGVLSRLVAMRAAEGRALKDILRNQVDDVARLSAAARASAEAAPAAIRARIERQLSELLAGAPVPADRLAEEAALIALKADVREELDRLDAHVDAAKALLESDEPAGRRLDFLGQEFNREANTLCSKAQEISLKRLGLDLKSAVDQFREQAQNVE